MKVAFFGGSFNPFHLGHKKVVDHLIKNFDKVLIAPVYNYKKKETFLKLEERIYCIKKIYNKEKKVEVLDWSLHDKKLTYTVNFIEKIKNLHPHWELNLVVGSDYSDISNWYRSADILKLASIYKVSRSGGAGINIESPDFSSTEIRKNIDESKLPKEVSKYLKNNQKILVLDLDHNLVYPTDNPEENFALPQIPPFEDVRFFLRPHLKEFLNYASKNYVIAAWSSSGEDYVNHVCSHLFKDHPILFSWSSKKCSPLVENSFSSRHIKRLSKVSKHFNKDIKEIVIIDDTPTKCRDNYGNFFYSEKFMGDLKDSDLLRLIEILKIIEKEKDITKFKKETLGDLWVRSKSLYKRKKRFWED